MALHHVLAVALLACLPLLTQAAFSPEEAALRKAITDRGARTYTLTKNIVLTADLPLLADGKVLKVQSRRGAQYTINGQNKYSMFRSTTGVFTGVDAIVDLTLVRLVITGAKEAVNIVGEGTKLSIDSVNFNKNDRALTLEAVNGNIVNSQFSKHKRGAIVFTSYEGFGDTINLSKCSFVSNTAEEGSGGGAIRVSLYATITADRCSFSKNTAPAFGGAVTCNRGSLFIVKNSKFDSNSAKRGGGALSLFRADAQVSDTTFTKNSAESVGGGAIRVAADDEAGSEVTLKNVAFLGNQAKTTLGGAFLLDSALIRICNCRFASNFGNGEANNGFVIGPDNVLTTSGETVPLLSVSPTAAISTGTAACP